MPPRDFKISTNSLDRHRFATRRARRNRCVFAGLGNFRHSPGVCERAQLVSSLAYVCDLRRPLCCYTTPRDLGDIRATHRRTGIGINRARSINTFIANPGMTSGRSASSAASASRTTCSTVTTRNFGPMSGCTPSRLATCWNSVTTGPGQSAHTLTPVPRNSALSASEKLVTYAFVAA